MLMLLEFLSVENCFSKPNILNINNTNNTNEVLSNYE